MKEFPGEELDGYINQLLQHREKAREKQQYSKADEIRRQIETLGYTLTDSPSGAYANKTIYQTVNVRKKPGLIALFGSGETSPTGRRIHEFLIKDFPPPVSIALLETPSGFEDNPHIWYQGLQSMMEVGLANFRPEITLVPALRKDGEESTNNDELLKPLLTASYIHTGAGSPTYAIKHLKNSKAYQYLMNQNKKGTVLSFASAAAISMGKYALPVYELYKAGEDLHWIEGLNFFGQFGLNLTIIPHWNNTEGGKDIDTSRCFMGKKRFEKLQHLLSADTVILGVDEHTAILFNVEKGEWKIHGKGTVTMMNNHETTVIYPNQSFSFA